MVSWGTHAENLFVSLLGKNEEEVNERLQQVWKHFFTPSDLNRYEADDEKSVYYEVSNSTAFILDTGNNDVRSEGMSYGMMISVQLDHREQFDKLWEWSKRNMAFAPDSKWDGYFCWQCKPDGTKIGGSNASDGELYYVTALFLASERWNEPRYRDEANKILTKVMIKDGRESGVYNLFDLDNGLITFVPDHAGHSFTDPSYMLPAFLDKWARTASANRSFWEKAATASRQHLIASAHPVTGLYPDYSRFDGRAYAWRHAAYDTSIYMFDAIRCPINVGMDYYLCGKDCHRQKAVMYRRQASSDIMKVWSIFFLCYTYQDVSHWTSDIKIDYKNSLSSDIVICLRNDKYSFVANLSIYTGINLILYNRELGIFQNLNEREFTYTAVPERLLLYEAIYGSRLLYIPYIN